MVDHGIISGWKWRRPGMLAGVVALAIVSVSCSQSSGQREFDRGIRELDRGNDVRAKALFEKSITRRPAHADNGLAYNYAGIAAARLGQDTEARKAFEESRRLNPVQVEPVYNLGVLAGQRGDIRTAQRYLNEAIAMNREDTTALEYLAHLYMQLGQAPRARNALHAARDRNPSSPRILTALATVELSAGGEDQAIELLMQALEMDPQYAPALYDLGLIYDAYLGEPDQAKAYYKKFLAHSRGAGPVDEARASMARLADGAASPRPVFPEPVEPPPVVPDAPPEATVPGAQPQPAGTDDGVALPIPEAPAAVEPVVAELDRLLKLGKEQGEQGQSGLALDTYLDAAAYADREEISGGRERALREAASVCFDLPGAHAALGDYLVERGRLGDAKNAYRRALSIDPDHVPSLIGQGRLAILQGEYDTALVTLRRALAADPTAADAHWELALLFDRHMELPENAARTYRSFAETFPGDARRNAAVARAEVLAPAPVRLPEGGSSAVTPSSTAPSLLPYRAPAQINRRAAEQAFRRAYDFQRKQNWEQAVFFYLRSLENDDRLANTFYNLGICYMMQGDQSLAAAAYREALRKNPWLTAARFNLALLYQREGDQTQAREQLEALLKDEPDYVQAHYALGVLLSENPATHVQAVVHYQRFLDLAPNDRSAPAVRAWIENHR